MKHHINNNITGYGLAESDALLPLKSLAILFFWVAALFQPWMAKISIISDMNVDLAQHIIGGVLYRSGNSDTSEHFMEDLAFDQLIVHA